jgi:fucose permease
MPTLIAGYHGFAAGLAAYSISIFFLLRAAGRFLGSWMLNRFQWTAVLALFAALIFACFAASVMGGVVWAIYLLPLSGLFMSVIYPTLNSKGISCLPKSEHGAGAGVILFFTCLSAVLAPFAIGAISDRMGGAGYGFVLATAFAAVLFIGLTLNWIFNPTLRVFRDLDETEYSVAVNPGVTK